MGVLPKISVIIPSLNAMPYIAETLKSILRQDYDNYEVIVMDGGSTDGTVSLLDGFRSYDSRITYVSEKDAGGVEAVNKGMRKASGDILTMFCADDVYERMNR